MKRFKNGFTRVYRTINFLCTPEGHISDETLVKRLEDSLVAFMNLIESVKKNPCIKKAGVELLREQPDPITEWVNIQ